MDKKEKTAAEKTNTKMVQMNRNMFNFIKSVTGVNVQMPASNVPDPNAPESYIPEYEIQGTSTTNQEFKFKVIIDRNDPELSRYMVINDNIKFKVSVNSELRFVLENYQVPETISIPEPEAVIESETKSTRRK